MKTKLLAFILLLCFTLIVLLFGCDMFNKKTTSQIQAQEIKESISTISKQTEKDVDMLDEFIDEIIIKNEENKNLASSINKEIKEITNMAEQIQDSSTLIDSKADEITCSVDSIKMPQTTKQEIKKEIDPKIENIKSESFNIQEKTGNIQNKSVIIDSSSEKIIKNLEEQKKETEEKAIPAKNSITESSEILKDLENKIKIHTDAIQQIEKEKEDALKAKEKAEQERDSALQKAITWLIVASIIGAGVLGVFGVMYGNKLSLTLSAMCIVVMSIAIFVKTYFIYLVIGGGIILVILIGFIIWDIIIQKKAFKEVVSTVEVAQDKIPEEERIKIFGGKGETGIMDTIQSPQTMNLVKQEKAKLSSLWNYAKNHKKVETNSTTTTNNS